MKGITNKLHHRISKLSPSTHLVAANYEFACLALRLPFTIYICRGTLIRDRCLQSSFFTAVSIFRLFPLRALGRLMLLAAANPALDFVSLRLWLTRCRILRRSLCLSSCAHYCKTPRWSGYQKTKRIPLPSRLSLFRLTCRSFPYFTLCKSVQMSNAFRPYFHAWQVSDVCPGFPH